jgi:hypothetical protein
MPRAEITIDVIGREEYVDARDFEAILKETIGTLDHLALASSAALRRSPHRWKITKASLHSPLHVTLTDESRDEDEVGEAAVHAFVEGLKQLDAEQVPTEPPPLFNPVVLRSVQRLVNVLRRDVSELRIASPNVQAISPTLRVALNVEELIGVKFRAYGAIEGIIETITIKGQVQFKIYDPATRDRIACIISPGQLEEAKAAFPHRVAVYGHIRYAKSGKPLAIEVETIRRLRSVEHLPQGKDIQGIDITGELSSDEYIRRLRDVD